MVHAEVVALPGITASDKVEHDRRSAPCRHGHERRVDEAAELLLVGRGDRGPALFWELLPRAGAGGEDTEGSGVTRVSAAQDTRARVTRAANRRQHTSPRAVSPRWMSNPDDIRRAAAFSGHWPGAGPTREAPSRYLTQELRLRTVRRCIRGETGCAPIRASV